MKKIKNCLLAVLVLCLMVTVLTACGDNKTTGSTTTAAQTTTGQTTTDAQQEPYPIYYTFTVIYGDTELPVEGAMVQLCQGETCLFPIAADAEGKVEYTYIANANGYGEYDVHIIEDSIPEGYSFDNTAVKTNETDKEYTLVLVKSGA